MICAVLMPALLTAGCGQAPTPGETTTVSPTASPTTVPPADAGNASAVPIPPSSAPSPSPTLDLGDGVPDLTPPMLTPEAERGVKGARNILLSLARAIEEREYSQAWALLSPADKRKWSRTAFATMFADLGKVTVSIPDGEIEGAAGSSYYTAPITVTGPDADGRPIRIEGKAVLRRVNDVEGATAAQLRWHFETLTLDWTH